MRVLVTGAAGFVGGYLIRELRRAHHTVVALDAVLPPERHRIPARTGSGETDWHRVDLLDPVATAQIVADRQPEALIHLAAIASVPQSHADPEQTYRVNVQGTLNLLRILRNHAPAARMLVISTAQVYGNRRRSSPLRESSLLEPGNAYAESKAWADFLALLYAERLGLAVMTARPHNHTGPGQAARYAVPAFARQVAAVVRGHGQLPLRTGNLDSRRDISDVRDVVAAYRLLLENGRPGRAYNVASGQLITMREILETFCRFAGIQPAVRVDPQRWRPTDESPLLDTAALRRDTGWEPKIPLEETLQAVWDEALAERECNDGEA